MPRSEDVANSFMSMGRGGSVDQSDNYPVQVSSPQEMGKVGSFDAAGSAKNTVIPDGVVYDTANEEYMRMFPHNRDYIMKHVNDSDEDDVKR